jgi:Uma2 family endonuclease
MATDAISNDSPQAVPLELQPDVEHLVTEDDTPVDNLFSEKQQRLLTEPLYSSWAGPGEQRSFVAMSNVGLFYTVHRPPLVPDALLSLDVEVPADLWPKNHRSYFVWEYGKTPDVVIEVVSNREGGEDSKKLAAYARVGVHYYVIFDPERLLGPEVLRAYRLEVPGYHKLDEPIWFSDVGLGLRPWQGRYEGHDNTWLRWVDAQGTPIPTGRERAESERQIAESERQTAESERQIAESERQRADAERQRADQLAGQLRQLGVEPPKP